MVCKSLGHLCGCDGTFLFPQAIGHVFQDHEEPIFLESTARVPTEDETQVGPLLGLHLFPLFFAWSSWEVPLSLSRLRCNKEGQSVRTVLKSLGLVVPFQINLCGCQCEQADLS